MEQPTITDLKNFCKKEKIRAMNENDEERAKMFFEIAWILTGVGDLCESINNK